MTRSTPIVADRVTHEVETITPEIAEAWLGRNSHNRALRNRHVEDLAGAIKRGEWRLNGDAIRFAKDGSLLDGQHRLWAVIEAGQPIESLVIRGLERDVQETMDYGARRRLSDALRLRGESNAAGLASVLSYFFRMESGQVRNGSVRPSVPQAMALLDAHPSIRDFVSPASMMNKRFRMSTAMLGAVMYQLDSIDHDDAEAFWLSLSKGAGLEEGSPIYVLRRWLEQQSVAGAGSRANALTTHALIVKAWNFWRDGEHIARLSWKATGTKAESFPEPH